MPGLATLAVFLLASFVLAITPGPSLLCVLTNSIVQGRKAGIISSLGAAAGMALHIFAVAFGLSALLLAVPLAFELVKIAGAAYLVYLGIKTILTKTSLHAETSVRYLTPGQIFRQGALSGILNPKAALFFLAFLPQFVDQTQGNVTLQILLLGFLFSLVCTIVSIGFALIASIATNWLRGRRTLSNIQRWATGLIFIAFGAQIALAERS